MLTISPNYDMLLQILLVMWVIRGVLYIICGLTQMDMTRQKAGTIEVVCGIVLLCLVAWVIL